MIAHLEGRGGLIAVLRSIVELGKNLMQADTATLYIYDEVTDTYNMATDFGATKPLDRTPRESGPTATIVREKKPLFSNEALEHPLFKDSPYTRDENIHSVAGIPLERGGAIIGVLYFNYRMPNQITNERMRIMELFAQLAAIAIENTLLLGRRDQMVQTLAALHDVGQSILSTQDILSTEELSRILESSKEAGVLGIDQVRVRVLELIAEAAIQVLGTDIVTVYEYDQANNVFKLPPAMAGNLRQPAIPRRTKIYPDDAAAIILDKRLDSYFAHDAQHDEIMCGPLRFDHLGRPKQRFVHREGIVSSGILRLKAGAETVGVMFVNFRIPQQFSEEQKAVIRIFGNQAALAIQNARIYKHIVDEWIAEHEKRLTAERSLLLAEFNDVAGTFFHRVVNEIGTVAACSSELRRMISPNTPEYQDILWYLDRIEADVKRFMEMAEKVRLSIKGIDMQLGPVDINQHVSNTIAQTIAQMARPSGVQVITELAPSLPIVNVDASMLTVVLRNILDNAMEAMPSGGELTVSTHLEVDGPKTFIEVNVRDTGKGIPKQVQPTLFAPFRTSKEKGLGIGLWQCKTYLQRMGGTVYLRRSEVGKGSTFTIRLPVTQ